MSLIKQSFLKSITNEKVLNAIRGANSFQDVLKKLHNHSDADKGYYYQSTAEILCRFKFLFNKTKFTEKLKLFLKHKTHSGPDGGCDDFSFTIDSEKYSVQVKYSEHLTYDGIVKEVRGMALDKECDYIVLILNEFNQLIEHKCKSELSGVKKFIFKYRNDIDDAIRTFNQYMIDNNYNDEDSISNMIKINENVGKLLILRFHQRCAIHDIDKLYSDNNRLISLAYKPRSGKTFIIAGLIHRMKFMKSLIVTTYPSETLGSWIKVFSEHVEFSDYNIYSKTNSINELSDLDPTTDKSCVVILSKQHIDSLVRKGNKHPIFNMKFDLIAIDETQNGGSTKKTTEFIEKLCHSDTLKISISATGRKAENSWSIPPDAILVWDILDEKLAKAGNIVELEKRNPTYGKFWTSDCVKQYEHMPELALFSNILDLKKYTEFRSKAKLVDQIIDFNELYCMSGDTEFKYPNEIKVFYKQLFSRDIQMSIINRIEKFECDENLSVGFLRTPGIVIVFIPPDGINKVAPVLIELLKNSLWFPKNIHMEYLTGDTHEKDVSRQIKKWFKKYSSPNENEKSLMIFVGKVLSAGATIKHARAVVLAHNSSSSDLITQQVYRCMTEDKHGKNYAKFRYIIDLNPFRVINMTSLVICPTRGTDFGTFIKTVTKKLAYIDPDIFSNNSEEYKKCQKEYNDNFLSISSKNPYSDIRRLHNYITSKIIFAINHEKAKELFKDLEINNIPQKKLSMRKKAHSNVGDELKSKSKKVDKIADENDDENDENNDDDQHTDENISNNNYIIIIENIAIVISIVSLLSVNTEYKNNFIEAIKMIMNDDQRRLIFNKSIEYKLGLASSNFIECLFQAFNSEVFKTAQDGDLNQVFNQMIDNMRTNIYGWIDTNNIERAYEIVTKCMTPTEQDKRQRGEVFTPLDFINKMLDQLPSDVWENENYKWLDPANGMGNFMICVYQRLFNSLKNVIPDDEKRRKHILEKMLYMSEINELNVFITKLLFDPTNTYKLNIYTGDTLQIDLSDYFDVEQFDFVIGNPPYNEELKQTGATSLYPKFVEKFIDDCGSLLFVIPARWFMGGKGTIKFRHMMINRRDIISINTIDEASTIFGSYVNISGGICTIYKSNDYDGDCLINNKGVNLADFEDVIYNLEYHEIVKKIKKLCEKYGTICTPKSGKIYNARGKYGIETNSKYLREKGDDDCYKCHVSQKKSDNKTGIMYVHKKHVLQTTPSWKVITVRASRGQGTGFGRIEIATPDEIHSTTFISFNVKSEDEAYNLKSYLQCGLTNFLLSICKISQDISEKTMRYIPYVPLDRQWNDKMLYKYFKFNQDDINLVESIEIKSG